jgi:hypothetical protein
MQKYSKQIGKYIIVADESPSLKNYTKPDGTVLDKSDIWDENETFYEQDYFALYVFKNLHVIDENGSVCSPIIKEIEFKNSGYVLTWNQVFWIQGYAILNDKIYFVSIGDDDTYYRKKPKLYELISQEHRVTDFSNFMERMLVVVNDEAFVDSLDIDSLSNCMLT